MKIRHFLFLLFLLPLTGCGLFHGDSWSSLRAYYTYGNTTDKTITVKNFQDDQTTIISSFTIAPGEEFTYPLGYYGSVPFSGPYVSVSNGECLFVQHYQDPVFVYYLFRWYDYQEIRIEDPPRTKVVYCKYVFSDKDFEASSGNNFVEVTN